MSVTEPYINKLNSIKSKIPVLAKKAVAEESALILNILKFNQLGVGLNSDGLPLAWSHEGQSGTGKYATTTQGIANQDPSYARIKPKTAGSPYNFQWSGETFAFMDIKIKTSEFEIFTSSGKQKLLEEIYDNEIFKLTKENNDFINETIILPSLIDYILNNFHRV